MRKYVSLFGLLLLSISCKAQVNIDPANPNIAYWGRVDFTNPQAPAFEFPGITIRARFTGTSITAQLNDFAGHGPTTTNYFYKIIDGGSPQKFEALKGNNSYVLASNLPSGSHTVELIKLTEANVGKTAFMGFTLDKGAALQALSNEPSCSIEFIGNSITCGYGNEVSIAADPNTGFQSVNENNYTAWGYVAARKLGMKYMTVSYSGRGLYRNYSGTTAGALPEIYGRIYPDNTDSPVWEHGAHPLNYIVIDLGTNDFATDPNTPLDQKIFESTYVKFVKQLKEYHPAATILLAVGVMMSDSYPEGAQHWTKIRNYVKNVVNTLTVGGQKEIYYFEMDPQQAPYGEDWHPSAATHSRMGNSLAAFINSKSSACSVTKVIPAKEEGNGLSIKLYPNPASSQLTLAYEGEELEWTIVGSTGQMLAKGKSKFIDTSFLQPGQYNLKIAEQVFKFVK